MMFDRNRLSIAITLGLLGCLCCVSCSTDYPTNAATPVPLVLELHPDGTVTKRGHEQVSLSGEAIQTTIRHYRAAICSSEVEDAPAEPGLTIVAAMDSKHGDLDNLLRTSVDCGIERFALSSAADSRSFSFRLSPPLAAEGLVNPDALPPLRLQLKADEKTDFMRLEFLVQGSRFVPATWVLGA